MNRVALAVRWQRDYADDRRVPWGISESAYNLVDRHNNYQYKAFGVPGLGLKRGLGDELVVAPYATALALMIDPAASAANLRRLAAMGLEGDYGFFDAIDFTNREADHTGVGRGRRRRRRADVSGPPPRHDPGCPGERAGGRSDGPTISRRSESPGDRTVVAGACAAPVAVDRPAPARPHARGRAAADDTGPPLSLRRTRRPHTQFLSNGNYVTAVTNAGGGSRCGAA